MRRILPVLVGLLLFSINTYAMPLEGVMPSCRGPAPGALGESCALAKSKLCPSGDACDVPEPTPAGDPVKECAKLYDDAVKGCPAAPDIPAQPPGKGGTKEICEQYNAEVTRAKSGNKDFAGTCRSAIALCMRGCEVLKPKTGAVSKDFDTAIRRCDRLIANAGQAEKQMDLLAANSIQAIDCSKQASSAPDGGNGGKDGNGNGSGQAGNGTGSGQKPASSGMGGMNPMAMMSMLQNMMKEDEENNEQPEIPALQDCAANSALQGCTTAAGPPGSWNTASADQAGAKGDESGGSFNPADIGGAQSASADTGGEKTFGTPPTNGTVAMGGTPLGGGGGGGAASLGGASGGGGGGGAPSKKIEVQTGGGGGYSSQNAAMSMKNGEGGGGGFNYGGRNAGQEENLDLASFLPGGSRAPASLKLGANSTGNFQIQSKDVNLFSRISERIKSRCAQGLLRDCIP